MESNSKEIRENAKLYLKGNWTLAILGTLVYSIVDIIRCFFPDSVDAYFIVLSIISDALFIFGYSSIILHIARREDSNLSDIFHGCKKFFKGLGMTLLVGLYTFFWLLLLIVPGFIAAIKYSMTFYIWVDNPDIEINRAIDESIELTNGHRIEIFTLILDFIGWFALILIPTFVISYFYPQYGKVPYLILSFGMLFLTPYIKVSMATLYNKLIKENNDKLLLEE